MKYLEDMFKPLCATISIAFAVTAILSFNPVPWLLGAILVYLWGKDR